MFNYTCDQKAKSTTHIKARRGYPVHVVIGMAGNTSQSPWQSYEDGHYLPPEWSIFRTMDYGFCHVEATGDSLTFRYVGDQDGAPHDYFQLTKDSTWDN